MNQHERHTGGPPRAVRRAGIALRSLFFWMVLAGCMGRAVPVLHAQELLLKHYTTQNEINPLPTPAVTNVYQDRQGYIWLVNYGTGLVRYDGQRMETYGVEDGLPDTDVFAVVQDGAGRLWLASSSLIASEKPLDAYPPGSPIRFTDSLGAMAIYAKPFTFPLNALVVDRAGDLWVGTDDDGIVRYHTGDDGIVVADTFETASSSDTENTRVLALAARQDGSVWVSLQDGRLLAFAPEASVPRTIEAANVPCSWVSVLDEDSSGVLWGACADHPVWRLDPDGSSGASPRFELVGAPLAGTPTAILEIAPGTLWIAGLELGIVETKPAEQGRQTAYTRTSGLLDMNVWALMQDREGNVWVAQNNGLSRLPANHAAFQFYTGNSHMGEQPILPAPDATAVLPGVTFAPPSGNPTPLVAVATSGGLALVRPDGSAEHIASEQGLRGDVLLNLCTDREQRLWMGMRQGISVLAAPGSALPSDGTPPRTISVFGERLQVSSFGNAPANTCRALPLPLRAGSDEKGEAVCFANSSGARCFAEGRWLAFGEASGLPEGGLWVTIADDEGYVYAGSKSDGLYRSTRPFSLDLLRTWSEQSPSREATGIVEVTDTAFAQVVDADGAPLVDGGIAALVWVDDVLWANTDSGVVALEGTPLRRTAWLGEKGTGLTSLARSPVTGLLWSGGSTGLTAIDPATRTVVRHITRQNGLLGDEAWGPGAIAIGADGTVYHGSSRGVTMYRPDRDPQNETAPLLAFRNIEFRQGNRGNNEISLQYAALSFAAEKLVRYKTRLVGYDEDWSPETDETSIRYTNLPAFFVPRPYTFEVLASNNDGVWTETPIRHTFSVQPPWWLRWWSFLIYAVLLAGGVFVVDRTQRRRLVRLEREKARERELEQAREIERAYEQLKTTQAQLVQQEKLASLGALTAGIAHEIKNPLNFVNNFAQLTGELVHELRDEAAERPETRLVDVEDVLVDLELNAAKIAEHGRRADGIVRGMLMHARSGTGARERTEVNALVDEAANLAYHGMRARKPGTDVTFERVLDPAVDTVEMVPQEISRVVLNLVNNALYAVNERKARPGGADDGYAPAVRVSTHAADGRVMVRVWDNGGGIPENVRARIFEPFFTTKPAGEGTGLGLSLAHEIVTQGHGGTLEVSVEKDETTFTLTLPATGTADDAA